MTTISRIAAAIVRGASAIVPEACRADWRREWRAELASASRHAADVRAELRLLARSVGSIAHALWLRWDHWRLEMLVQDLRHAVRALARRPGFALVTILTLALGIGANAAIFSAAYTVLARPLPYPEPDRLVRVYTTPTSNPDRVGGTLSPPDFTDYRAENRTLAELGAYYSTSVPLTGDGEPTQIPAAYVTGGFFPTMGVRSALGRTIGPDDDAVGGGAIAVLSHGLWQRRFGGREDVVGRRILLDGISREVVGVMPDGFGYPLEAEVWLPLRFDADDLATQRGAHYLSVVGRVDAGQTPAAARADLRGIASRLAVAYPSQDRDQTVSVHGLRDALVGRVRPAMLVLVGAVGFVLLIVCVNVAGLVLTRAVGRSRELAIRAAVGADRPRLLRSLLVESAVLAAAGGTAGLLLAVWGTALIARANADANLGVPLLDQAHVDGTVLLFTALLSLAVAVLFGAVPAWQASRVGDVVSRLREEGGGATGNRGRQRARGGLIVLETALAVVLLVGAGLLARSFARLAAVDTGVDPRGVQTFTFSLPDSRYPEPRQRAAFVESLLTRLRQRPGVEAVGGTIGLPLTSYSYYFSTSIVDGQRLPDEEQDRLSVQLRVVTPGYFEAVGMRLLRGRGFTDADRLNTSQVMVVSEAAARLLWPGDVPLGHELRLGTRLGLGGDRVGGQVVGVVNDVLDDGPASEPEPTVYLAHAQYPMDGLTMAIRTAGEPSAVIPPAREILASLDPDLPLFEVRSLAQVASGATAQPRLLMLVLAVFAGTAVLLAAIGLYGVLAHAVAARTREIGIRIALGARRGDVVAMIVGQAGRLAVAGVALGALAAVFATRLLSSLLYGVEHTDLVTYAAVTGGLTLVALGASWLPARRAARIDPATTLRTDQL
ncbi:MAG: ABC transporter permease [Vicinamibacterales bacterium]